MNQDVGVRHPLTPVRLGTTSIQPFGSFAELLSSVFSPDGAVIPGFAVAINPEKVVRAAEDRDLQAVLDSATLRFADGIGVVWALRRRGAHAVRLAGADFWVELMKESARRNARVYLLGGQPDVSARVEARLARDVPGIKIVGRHHGFIEAASVDAVIDSIVTSAPDVVTVAMGSPRQEKIISRLRQLHPRAFYLGVGGTYDVYVGRVRRAPIWMQRAGLEWLYRLLSQPWRAGRQFALIRFLRMEICGEL